MTLYYYSNLAPSGVTLNATITGVATSATVTPSLAGFPTSYPYKVAIDRGTANEELVLVTNSSGVNVTLQRAFGSTTAKSHNAGASFEHVIDATDASEANTHVNASSATHGVVGSLVGTTDIQTVSNKVIQSSTAEATSTDPALITKRSVSGGAPHIRGVDPAGTSTEFQIGVAGAASFGNTSVGTLATTGAVTAPSVTLSGELRAVTLRNDANSFTVASDGDTAVVDLAVAGNATVAGNLTVTGDITVDDITADDVTVDALTATSASVGAGTFVVNGSGSLTASANVVTRVTSSTSATTTSSSGTTEVLGHTIAVNLVNGRRYRVVASGTGGASDAAGAVGRVIIRYSTAALTTSSTTIEARQFYAPTSSGVGQVGFMVEGEIVAAATASHNIGLGVARINGAGNSAFVDTRITVFDVGT